MPIYEFDCLKCGVMFEELVRSPGGKIKCEDCGSAKVKRRLSVFGLGSSGESASSSSSCTSCSTRSCTTCR